MAPSTFFVASTRLFQALEDMARHKADAVANGSPCRVLDRARGKYVDAQWKDLVAGDVVLATTKSPKNVTFGAPRRLPSLRRTSAPVSPGPDVVHEEKEEEHCDDAT